MSPLASFARSSLPLVACMAAIVGITGACGSSDTSSPDQSAPAVARGAEVYAASCASCHGEDLRGTDKGPSHLSIVYEPNHHTDDSFRSAIANGAPQHHWTFGDMPAIGGLSPEDVDSVIAFVRAEQQRRGFER
ncbi:MAG: cytochrome c [Acidimicrobiia bacterium]|nr:cytochrome c [Acidimicrobiia bacterium]